MYANKVKKYRIIWTLGSVYVGNIYLSIYTYVFKNNWYNWVSSLYRSIRLCLSKKEDHIDPLVTVREIEKCTDLLQEFFI